MSKKTLKRSLALGALMAFVITGSAMAAGSIKNESYNSSETITANTNYGVRAEGSGVVVNVDVPTGDTLTIFVDNTDSTKDYFNLATSGIAAIRGGNVILNGNLIVDVEGKTSFDKKWMLGVNTGADYSDSMVTIKGDFAVITAKNSNSTTGYTAQGAAGDGDVYFNSKKTTINAESYYGVNGVHMTNGAAAHFNGEYVTINSVLTDGQGYNAIGVMGNVSVANSVKEFTINVTGAGIDDVNGDNGDGTAAVITKGQEINIDAKEFYVNVDAGTGTQKLNGNAGNTYGLRASNGGVINVTSSIIDVDVIDKGSNAYGVRANCNDLVNKDGNIVNGAGTINLGGANSVITIDATAKNGYAVGIAAHRSNDVNEGNASAVTVNGQSLTINATGKTAYGILGMNNTTGRATNVSTVTINSADTTINAKSGLVALSQSKINVNGNLTVNSEGGDAIVSRGGATVNINTEGNKVVKLTGDIDFNYNQATSGSKIDAAVNLNLTNADSFFTGKIYKSGDATIPNDKDSVTGMNISLSNGAKWNLTGESIVTNATFGADSVLNINGEDFDASTKNAYALNASEGTPVLTVNEGAKLVIEGADLAKTYNIAKGFAEGAGENWTLEADNALWYAKWIYGENAKTLQATVALKDAEQLVNTGVVEDAHADFVATVMKSEHEEAKDVKEFLKEAVGAGSTPAAKEQAKEKIAQAFQAGEAAGTSATAANIVKNTTGATTQRMSFSNRPSAHKGGHGPSVSEDKNGGAIWAQYVHGKDKVTDMPMAGTTASYEGKFNGVVLGADFKQVGKYQSGVSFNYGEGDTYSTGSSAYSRNDYDFWGVGYYGAVQNADSNVIFDVNYAKSDTDVEQLNSGKTITASPETTTWSAGVRVEKFIDKGSIQYVPYAGLRYMSIDTDSYTNSLNVVTETDRQDIWLLPVGVSFRQDNVYDSGWVVTPKVDLSYIWAFGDTESEMTIDVPGATDVSFSRLGYTVMDDGSFLGSIGLEASKGDWTFGVAYSYQKGEYSRSDKWYVDAKYSF